MFHYQEIQDLSNMNIFRKAYELHGWIAIGFMVYILIVLVIGAILFVISGLNYIIIKKEKQAYENNEISKESLKKMTLVGLLALILGFVSIAISIFYIGKYQTIGYYQAEAKVMNIEKTQKVDGKTNYTFELRYINGVTVDKKTAPLKIKQKDRQGIKNGDKVLIKTSEKTFRGNEDKDIEISSIQKSDLTIHKL
ncbi:MULTISPECIES: hypothetical protein [Staphylococcus]|nr:MULTISPECIES: hypothetical protein [Staphylococcus]HDB3375015.1 hypothetical protein [Staphylococcus aureus]EWJ87725.1 hypothetical protein U607_02862 [Staphylococcus aureus F36687]EWT79993.1 hypothetical protein V330_02857 [Staphylococcus aureus F85609]EWV01910.1 hypothetical protein U621_02789 [Staphylococcus aureus F53393]HDE6393157.1 hypothetical protein [Staphylococcus aureus]